MMAIVGYHPHPGAAAAADGSLQAERQHRAVAVQRVLGRGDHRQYRRLRAGDLQRAARPGGFGNDPFGHTWTWDNTDVRFARTASIGSLDLIYGITANNNPTVQDVWNTTPAWAFPYAASSTCGHARHQAR